MALDVELPDPPVAVAVADDWITPVAVAMAVAPPMMPGAALLV